MAISNGIETVATAGDVRLVTSKRRARRHGTGLLLLAALAWGTGNVSQKTILDHLDAYAANGITCLIGAAVLYPLARREPAAPTNGSRGLLLLVALTFTLAATLMQVGYGHTSVTNAGFLVNTSAVLTPVIGWFLFRQCPPLLIWPASLCALSGVFLMGGGALLQLAFGDVLALAAGLAFAFWNLFVAQYVTRYHRALFMTVIQLLCCGVVCLGISVFANGLPDAAAVWAALPEIVMLGVVSKGLAYALMALGMRSVSASAGAILVSTESIFGAACAAMFLAERAGYAQGIGGLFIICGVVLASCASERVERRRRSS